MKLIKVGNRIINPQMIAYVKRTGNMGPVEIHFPVPKATMMNSQGVSDHCCEVFHGEEGDLVWRLLESFWSNPS